MFADQAADEELVPFLKAPRSKPDSLDWETLTEWITPQDQTFSVQHYGIPKVRDEGLQLKITGSLSGRRRLDLDALKALPRDEQYMTLECSGNGSSPGFMNAVYNSRWGGTRLAPLLKECGIKPGATEVVFFGHDQQTETLRKGTPRELTVEVPFGRSMTVDDVHRLDPLLAYERNGEPFELRNGAPLRLIVPGWYGIANVKWLRRIEVRDRRYMGRFMARDYVTVRGEKQGDEVVFVEKSVTRMNLKSVVARVTRQPTKDGKVPLKAMGPRGATARRSRRSKCSSTMAIGERRRLDEKPLEKFSWRFFSIDLGNVEPGKHTIVSRAIDENGRDSAAAEEDEIALKKTYWEAYQQWPRTI